MATPRIHRQRRAEELRRNVDQLLATARHEALQQFLRRAISEIEEASECLARPDVDARPALLTIIDMDLAFAEFRIRTASTALNICGPDAATIG
jgi:hypothetical protein